MSVPTQRESERPSHLSADDGVSRCNLWQVASNGTALMTVIREGVCYLCVEGIFFKMKTDLLSVTEPCVWPWNRSASRYLTDLFNFILFWLLLGSQHKIHLNLCLQVSTHSSRRSIQIPMTAGSLSNSEVCTVLMSVRAHYAQIGVREELAWHLSRCAGCHHAACRYLVCARTTANNKWIVQFSSLIEAGTGDRFAVILWRAKSEQYSSETNLTRIKKPNALELRYIHHTTAMKFSDDCFMMYLRTYHMP